MILKITELADNNKVFRMEKFKADCEELQEDISKLGEWAPTWQTNFNVGKDKVIHTATKKS